MKHGDAMLFHKAPHSHGCGRLNQRLKFYHPIEAGGTWILNQPISDLFTVIRVLSALYLIVVIVVSTWYSSIEPEYNAYWMGIYSWWILLVNTMASILSAYTTSCIWYRYKYPHTLSPRRESLHSHHSIQSLARWDFESVPDSVPLHDHNDEERMKQIDLHSDTDVTPPDHDHISSHHHAFGDMIHCNEDLNAMSLDEFVCSLSSIHKISKFLSNIGVTAQFVVAVGYWIMADQRLENGNDDTDWMVTVLNIQSYILIPMLLLFLFCSSFIQLRYMDSVWVLLFDGIFTLYILMMNVRNQMGGGAVAMVQDHDRNRRVTVFGRFSIYDEFSYDLLSLFFVFICVHMGCQWGLTLFKNMVLIHWMKWLRHLEITRAHGEEIDHDPKLGDLHHGHYHHHGQRIAIHQVMDPLDLEVVLEDYAGKTMSLTLSADDTEEGSDVGYSSYDFNASSKMAQRTLKKKKNQKEDGNDGNTITKRLRLQSLHSKYKETILAKWNALKTNKEFQSIENVRTVEPLTIDAFGSGLESASGAGLGGIGSGGGKGSDRNSVRIVFGSDIHQRFDRMPAVRALTAYNPDIVVFLGNNIYIDETPRKWGVFDCSVDDDTEFRHSLNGMFHFWKTENVALDPSTEYQKLLKHKDFILCNPDETLPMVLATWDKHDMDRWNKYHSKSAFLSFLDTVDMRHELSEYIDIMKSKTYRGIYYHYDFHHVFTAERDPDDVKDARNEREDEKEEEEEVMNENEEHLFLRFILLDLQFDRQDQDLFGPEQWQWLCQLLTDSVQRKDQPDWHIFGFGSPCFVEQFDLDENMRPKYDLYGNPTKQKKENKNDDDDDDDEDDLNSKSSEFKLPEIVSPIPIRSGNTEWDESSKRKLLMLLKEVGIADRTLFLSGNTCYHQVLQDEETSIHELVSSSMTHSMPSLIPYDFYIKNEYQFGSMQTDVCCRNGYGHLEINKNGWTFCVRDAAGNAHIPFSKTVD